MDKNGMLCGCILCRTHCFDVAKGRFFTPADMTDVFQAEQNVTLGNLKDLNIVALR